ncbi:thiol reductant ABC exporter subunit CydC [Commensalibacter intestini]|uniref:thiol reductant ABC exporter subunit CydC n=1 Tax=Commensalibacter intestini TaxID=479936 RepID=UPI000A39EC92|nr:thiol reductant ABC exporter subunit CydC [Commensalibacter intestini]
MQDTKIFPNKLSLINFVKPIKWHLALGMLLSCVAALSNFGLLFVSGWLITSAAVAGLAALAVSQAFNIMLPAAGVRFFAMARILSRYLERIITHDGAFRLTSSLRTAVYALLIPQTPSGLMDKRGGDILGQFVSDTETVSAYYTDAAIPFGRALCCSIVFIGLISCFLPIAGMTLGAALIIAGAIVPIVTYWMSYRLIKQMRFVKSRMQGNLAETLQNLGELLILTIADSSVNNIKQDQLYLDQGKLKLDIIESTARSLITVIMMIVVLLVLFQSISAYRAHLLSAAEIPMLVLGIMAAFDVILPLPAATHAKIKADIAEQQLQASCNHTVADQTEEDLFVSPNAPYDLVMKQVSFSYPQQPSIILDHASLTIKQGEHVAIVGASGMGKSSLINMLFSFYPLQTGSIFLGGVDVKKITCDKLSSFVSVVSQDFHLFSGTIKENLKLINPEVTDKEIKDVLKIVQLDQFVKELLEGIHTFIGNEGVRLSGGQARRLAIAQGLLRKTPWLILDEPTDGLDSQTEQALMQQLMTHYTDQTIVVITHKSEILPLMDRVILLQDGCFHAV